MLRRSLAGAIGVGLTGCGEILDIPSDPRLINTDPWACAMAAPSAPVIPKATATVRFQACDFISGCTRTVTGLTAQVCEKLDVGCVNPRATGIRDQGGLLEFELPTPGTAFDGFVQVTTDVAPCFDTEVFGAAARSGLLCQFVPTCDQSAPTPACNVPIYYPILWFFNPPVTADIEAPIPLALYPSAALPSVIEAAGGTVDLMNASVFLTTTDCQGQPAGGVSLQISEHQDIAQPLYFRGGVLSNTATETDPAGLGGFIRVPPGFVEVSGTTEDGLPAGEVGVQTYLPFVTYTVLSPVIQ